MRLTQIGIDRQLDIYLGMHPDCWAHGESN
jgi:hypothetical protein